MKIIGVTGGIGSGKTTICQYIESLGYNVYYSDDVANELVQNNENLKQQIIDEFGEQAYLGGVYDRKYMAELVFNDQDKLNRLNSIFKCFMDESFAEYSRDKDLIFYESALIFELNLQDRFDSIICAYADPEDIIVRLKERNGFTDEEIDMRLNSQVSPKYKVELSDFVVDTTNLNEAYSSLDAILKLIDSE